MAVKLSIIIPTLGRSTLAATLASCADADEIVVVLDTSRGGTLPCELPDNAVFAQGDFGVTGGHAGRQLGISMAAGTHLAFFDDDDVYTPGAVGLMRGAACDRPVIFRMDHYAHGILWRTPQIEFGNVSTQMYVVPNDPARLGSWKQHIPGLKEPGGDYTFIKETCELMGEPVWRDEVTSVIRPHERGPSISIVTPWLDHRELIDDYLAAMQCVTARDRVLVVDNGSTLPLDFAAIRLDANQGFSRACNLGLAEADTDAVLFLNNDIVRTRYDWLNQLRDALEPGVLVGANIRHDAHGNVDGRRLPYLDGWCVAGMRDDLVELGGWDEAFEEPSYYGDNDLCLRARLTGMTLREVRVGLRHLENVTAGSGNSRSVLHASRANYQRYAEHVREAFTEVGV